MVDFKKLSQRKRDIPHTKDSLFTPTQHEQTLHIYYTEYTQMTAFDAKALLGATVTEASTRRPPIPANTQLIGVFGEPDTRQVEGKKETNRGVIYTFLEIPVEFDLTQNPDIRQIVGQDKVTLRWSGSLDITPSGGLDMSPGKNTAMRILREALDMNKEGQPFSFQMVQGRPVRCVIGNETYQGDIRDNIQTIARV